MHARLDDEACPYPLRRHFHRLILPALGLLLLASVLLTVFGGRELVESVYLQVAQQRADSIARAAKRQAPGAWDRLWRLTGAEAVPPPEQMTGFATAMQTALADTRLEKLKIYDGSGRLLYNTDGTELGSIERGVALVDLLDEQEPQIVLKESPEGALYELYVWLPDEDGTPRLIFELYEPVDYLDALMLSSLAPQVAVPAALVLLLTALLWRLVGRAQGDIDRHTRALSGMRDRLARLVSAQAVGAARRAGGGEGMESQILDATLYYADVRDFTSFAEETPPQQVVAFLNRMLSIQVRLVRAHGGDIDKMIGDAVLAVFEGPDRAARAVACAAAVQQAMAAEEGVPRGLGIGLHDGHVISGVIGPAERQDFTVIGDAVNVAARLCSLAEVGDVVADTRTLARAGHPEGFGPARDVLVKGRAEPLRVRFMSA